MARARNATAEQTSFSIHQSEPRFLHQVANIRRRLRREALYGSKQVPRQVKNYRLIWFYISDFITVHVS
jgi:hypothetical protein